MNLIKTSKQKGAALAEYGIVVGLVAVVAIASVSQLGQFVSGSFDEAASTIEIAQEGSAEGDAGGSNTFIPESNDTLITEDAPSTSVGAPEINARGTATAGFEEGDDTDFYLVRLTDTSDLNAVATDSAGRVVRQIALYDASNVLLGFNWATEWEPDSSAGVQANDLPAGDYFVRILSNAGAVGDYTIVTSTRDDVANTRSGATSIALGSSYTSDFVTGDFQDFFKVVLPVDGDLNVLVENIDNRMIKQIAIYDAGGGLRGYNWGNSTQATHTQANLTAGTYFIRLERSGDENGDYRITAIQ